MTSYFRAPVARAVLLLATIVVAVLVLLVTYPIVGWLQRRWTPESVLDAFRASGLEVSDYRAFDQDPDPELPPAIGNGVAFKVWEVSLCLCSGHGPEIQVLTFDLPAKLASARKRYDQLLTQPKWQYVDTIAVDNVLLVISPDIPPDLAREYEAALAGRAA